MVKNFKKNIIFMLVKIHYVFIFIQLKIRHYIIHYIRYLVGRLLLETQVSMH